MTTPASILAQARAKGDAIPVHRLAKDLRAGGYVISNDVWDGAAFLPDPESETGYVWAVSRKSLKALRVKVGQTVGVLRKRKFLTKTFPFPADAVLLDIYWTEEGALSHVKFGVGGDERTVRLM